MTFAEYVTTSQADNIARSYATLARHKRNGTFDTDEALMLLATNVRSAAKVWQRHTGAYVATPQRRRVTQHLLERWQAANA